MRILGIDPGSKLTGYGCVEKNGNQIQAVTQGTISLGNSSKLSFEDRLLLLYESLSEIIREFKPLTLVVERVFFAKNASSALKLGQTRGAVLLTGKIHSLNIIEYSATEVKLAVVGYGQADKAQVAKMVQMIVGQQKFPTLDASDALALAICHAQTLRTNPASANLQFLTRRRTKKRLSLAESVEHSLNPRKKF